MAGLMEKVVSVKVTTDTKGMKKHIGNMYLAHLSGVC